MMKKIFSSIGIAAMLIAFNAFAMPQPALAFSTIEQINPGDLIRGESFSAVYYMGEDGFRYVFPNDKTYFTWYDNFDSVKWLTDADLGTIQIGGNVTYKPGSKMLKINSDPKTYAVGEGGSLHWVTTEAIAIALYGTDWNTKIDDVPDGFFSNYHVSWTIEQADDYDADEMAGKSSDINDDKDLKAPHIVSITDNAYSETTTTVDAGTVIKWVNNGNNKHTATSDDLTWGTGTLNNGQHFSRYFREPGTYTYKCSYHPDTMTATIIVE